MESCLGCWVAHFQRLSAELAQLLRQSNLSRAYRAAHRVPHQAQSRSHLKTHHASNVVVADAEPPHRVVIVPATGWITSYQKTIRQPARPFLMNRWPRPYLPMSQAHRALKSARLYVPSDEAVHPRDPFPSPLPARRSCCEGALECCVCIR